MPGTRSGVSETIWAPLLNYGKWRDKAGQIAATVWAATDPPGILLGSDRHVAGPADHGQAAGTRPPGRPSSTSPLPITAALARNA